MDLIYLFFGAIYKSAYYHHLKRSLAVESVKHLDQSHTYR